MCGEESIMTIDRYGTKRWRNKKGEYHRIGGPAVEWYDGDMEWRINGRLHRIDGPAIKYVGASIKWVLRGLSYDTKEDFFEALTDEEKSIAIFSEDFLNA